MKRMRELLAVAVAVLVAAPAAAVSTDGYDIPYVGAYYAYEFGDSHRDSDDGQGYQFSAGMPLAWGHNNALELSFYDVGRERDLDGDKDYQTSLFVDFVHDYGTRELSVLKGFKPFFLAGLGAVREDVRGDEHWHAGLDAGAGLLFPLPWYGLAVRSEARALLQQNDKSVDGEDILLDYRVNLGLQLPLTPLFGEREVRIAEPEDCDIAVVDPKTGRADCGLDTDHDGIQDSIDQCPGTRAGALVDTKGCPVASGATDTDRDGVPDVSDRCPETKQGLSVDKQGCVIGQTMALQGVRFHENSAELTDASKSILDGVARTLNSQKNLKVEIGGHTDAIGTEAFNLLLSQQRAESVRQYLIAHGVAAARLTAQGYGEFQPVSSNQSETGREANRRVEFKIIVE